MPGVVIVRSGVGKSNAAGATAGALNSGRFGAVLSVGIAGAMPLAAEAGAGRAERVCGLLEVVVAEQSVFADEGIAAPGGFIDMGVAGFGPFDGGGMAAMCSVPIVFDQRVQPVRRGTVATVSTCSGTDAGAREVAIRTGAIAEAMEGAAVAVAAQRLGVAFGEVRVISNTTGDRTRQVWNLPGSLAVLGSVLGRMVRG
jgi:futalosine hydrolase